MKLRHYIFLIICLFTVISCKPSYFPLEDNSSKNRGFGTAFNEADYTNYNFNLKPLHYFKNNKKNTALFSDSSDFIRKNLLLHLDTQSDILDLDRNYYINQSSYNIDVYIESLGIGENLKEGTKVYMRCASGKLIDGEQQVRYALLYEGNVGPTIMQGDKPMQLIFFDNLTKVKKKKTKVKFSDKKSLAILTAKKAGKIIVYGVIDINHHNKSSKSEIYDMRSLFGTELWFNKINS